ncbi:MAG: CPBP family intramembrane metalloprotease [Anaerolineae bacterium]|nr:CPBP family intramembrane metalloprotease [Anaerolineae bacterium]
MSMSVSQNENVDRIEGWKQFVYDRPVIFSLLVILISGLLTEVPFGRIFIPWVGQSGDELVTVLIGHTLTGLLLVWLLLKLDLFQHAGFTPLKQWRAVGLVWPFVIFTLLNLDSLISGSLVIDTSRPGLLVIYIFRNLAIGFLEEVMARSVVLVVMLQKWGNSRRGVYRAVLVASVLFGISHIFNFLAGRTPVLASLTQMTYSFVFGVAFCACFLRNNSIWPVMVMHALVDMAGGLRHISVGGASQVPIANNTMAQVINTLIISVPLLLYGLFILRKVNPVKGEVKIETVTGMVA